MEHLEDFLVLTRVRRPGCLSIEGERADPSRILAYAEADPKADMQIVIFTQAGFFNHIWVFLFVS